MIIQGYTEKVALDFFCVCRNIYDLCSALHLIHRRVIRN